MKASFSLGVDIDVRCTACNAERELPIGTAQRVLEADSIYADTLDACTCGATRIAVEVKIDDGSEEKAPLPDERGKGGRPR